MHNLKLLAPSFLVVLVLLGIGVARMTFSAYGSVLGGQKFGYKFDKTRLPRWGYTLLAFLAICFIYALLLTDSAGGGVGFCIIVLPFAALGCLLSVCYVPLNAKRKSTTKLPGKSKKIPGLYSDRSLEGQVCY